MATERVTTRDDGQTTERVVERDGGGTTYVDRRGGSGLGGVMVGIAVLALVAIVAFFLMNQSNNDAIRTDAVTSAAASVADTSANAARDVGNAANSAANAANDAAASAAKIPPQPVNPAPAPAPEPSSPQ